MYCFAFIKTLSRFRAPLQSIRKTDLFSEPFGELLFSKLLIPVQRYNDAVLITPIKRNMFFRNMYRNTQSGALQDNEKQIPFKRKYKSSATDGILLGHTMYHKGSVVVTADGLIEEGNGHN
jgi:hypothetical protein